MKKFYLILLLSILSFSSYAQPGMKGKKEKIKAFRTAHITEALGLSTSEAEKFWPIYNASEDRIDKIKHGKSSALHKKMRDAGGLDNLSDKEAIKMLTEFTNIEINIANEKKKLFNNLKGIISPQKAIKLIQAERSFGRELLRKFRAERKEKKRE